MITRDEWITALRDANVPLSTVDGWTCLELAEALGIKRSRMGTKLSEGCRRGLIECRWGQRTGVDGIVRRTPVYRLKGAVEAP